MLDARILINVSDQPHAHHNGLSGNYIVPAKGEKEFGILVVYSAHEVQDVGNQAKTEHWPSSLSVALDILGKNSDAHAHTQGAPAGAEKWGIFLCEAAPDIPKELQQAIDEERVFLNDNPPEIKQKRDRKSKMMLATTVDAPEIAEQKQALSDRVAELRQKFEDYCRKLVTKAEVAQAKKNLQVEDQRLVSEGDQYYAGNDQAKRNISELHKGACRRLGQTRPWCYVAQQLVACPGCGAMIAENILTCPQCTGWLDEGIEQLRVMKPKERAMKMYPERYGEPVGARGQSA
jgi:antitoxin component HigA of HigAB toxin-antitoxin module